MYIHIHGLHFYYYYFAVVYLNSETARYSNEKSQIHWVEEINAFADVDHLYRFRSI